MARWDPDLKALKKVQEWAEELTPAGRRYALEWLERRIEADRNAEQQPTLLQES